MKLKQCYISANVTGTRARIDPVAYKAIGVEE